MAEYIEREALKETILSNKLMAREPAAKRILQMIEDAPAADVAPVKHAEWKFGELCGQSGYYCSECGAGFSGANENTELIARSHDYCPKCGAKMDGSSNG